MAGAPSENSHFEVLEPVSQSVPLVFNSPHSGRRYPQSFLAQSRLDALGIRRSEDHYVDELFSVAPALGAREMRDQHRRAKGRSDREELVDIMVFRPADAERVEARLREEALWITPAAMGGIEDKGHALRNRLQHFEVAVFAQSLRHCRPLPCLKVIPPPMLPAASARVHTEKRGIRGLPCPIHRIFTGIRSCNRTARPRADNLSNGSRIP